MVTWMPKFSTRCLACEHDWDDILKYDEWPKPCPECASERTVRLPSYPSKPFHRDTDPCKTGNLDPPIKSYGNDRRKGGKDTTSGG
jgi:hypothetical protein